MDTEMVKAVTQGQELQIGLPPPERMRLGSRNSTDASNLRESTPDFADWARKKCVKYIKSAWSNEEFDNFMSSLKYPAFIKEDKMFNFVQTFLSGNGIKYSLKLFRIWRDGLNSEQLEVGDAYGFQLWFQYIIGCWINMTSKIRNSANEATIRTPMDCIVSLAFADRPKGGHEYRQEAELVLPGTPDVVKVDAVATKAFPEEWAATVRSMLMPWNFSWSYSELAMSTPTLILEAKMKDLEKALRQLQIALFSAQMQRRALRMKNGPVFGAILDDGVLSFYVSIWTAEKDSNEEQELIVRPVLRSYNLLQLGRYLEAYFVLCRIAEFQSQWLDDEFKRWDEDDSQVLKLEESESKPWRKEVKPPDKRGSQAGDTGVQDGDGGTEEDAIEDLGEAELDDDEEVENIRLAVAREPFPQDGYSLTRKRLYVLIKMPEESQPESATPILDWVKRTNACAAEFTHVYSPEYDANFEDDSTWTTAADSESNAGTLVGDYEKSPVKAVMVEKKNVDAGLHDSSTTGGKVMPDDAAWSTKHRDATSKFCHYGEVGVCEIIDNVS